MKIIASIILLVLVVLFINRIGDVYNSFPTTERIDAEYEQKVEAQKQQAIVTCEASTDFCEKKCCPKSRLSKVIDEDMKVIICECVGVERGYEIPNTREEHIYDTDTEKEISEEEYDVRIDASIKKHMEDLGREQCGGDGYYCPTGASCIDDMCHQKA